MDRNKKKLEKLKHTLTIHLNENLHSVYLFGSQANQTATELLDYDILVVLRSEYDWIYKDKIYELCYGIELLEDVFFDINIISLTELNTTLRGKQPFITNIINKGVLV